MAAGKAYHNYFDGYSESEQIMPNGKVRILRVYTGDYYVLDLPDMRWKTRKLLVAVCGLLAILGTVAGACFSECCVWYSVIPLVLALFCLLWLMPLVVYYLTSGRKMEKRAYKDRENMITAAMATGTFLCLTAAASLIRCLCCAMLPELIAGGLYAIGAAAALTLGITENRQCYIREHNPMVPPENSTEIEATRE